jgi:hypothetical protein
VVAQLLVPGDGKRSSGQELRRRLMRGRCLIWSVSFADMIRVLHQPNSR